MYNLYQINHIKFKNIYHENLHIILGIAQIARGTATVVQCGDISTVYHSFEVFQSWCISLRAGQLGP